MDIRRYEDAMIGEPKPIKNANAVFECAINKISSHLDNVQDKHSAFYEEMSILAYELDFLYFAELFSSLDSLEFTMSLHRPDSKHTYIHSINSLAGIAVVDFIKMLYKVYLVKGSTKPENLDKLIKFLENINKQIFS